MTAAQNIRRLLHSLSHGLLAGVALCLGVAGQPQAAQAESYVSVSAITSKG